MSTKENLPSITSDTELANDTEQQEFNMETIEWDTNSKLKKDLDAEKEKMLEKLKKAKNIEERVQTFAKRTDEYWIEAMIWMIPGLSIATGAIASNYLLAECIRMRLPLRDAFKILWYQFVDLLVWILPFADFFYEWNKYSAKLFSDHLDKLKKAALERWISQEEIDKVTKREEQFIRAMDKYEQHEEKKENKKKWKGNKKTYTKQKTA